MRILFLAHRLPYPPTFGSKLRAFYTIRHLARQHEVTVMAPVRNAEEAESARQLAGYCDDVFAYPLKRWWQALKVLGSTLTLITASEAYFHSARMYRSARQVVGRSAYDFVFVHCSSIGRAVAHLNEVPKLIDFCDVDSRKWLDYVQFKPWPLAVGYRWEAHRLARVERWLTQQFDLTTVATAGEREALLAVGAAPERVETFPNGVDTEFFKPAADGDYDRELIAFVGRMDYFPNEQGIGWFCREVWPQIRQRRPAARLQIVGAYPTAAVRRLAQLPGVEVTGAVPDVRPYVQRASLTLAPLRIARGTQNKILESMAMQVPVVASPIAARGVDAVAGEHLLQATTATEFAHAVLQVLNDSRLRSRLGRAARQRVLSHHAWPSALARLDAFIERCIASRQAQAIRLLPAAAK